MINILTIKQHSAQPYYFFTIRDTTGAVINLTGSTIYATVIKDSDSTIVINRDSSGIKYTASSDDILLGRGHFEWPAGFTDTAGLYNIELEIVPTNGADFTVPTTVKAQILVVADFDGV